MLIKQKSSSLPRNLALGTFGELLIVFSTKVGLLHTDVLSSASDKGKLIAKDFSKNSNLDDSGISLPVFPSRTDLKLHISVTPKMVKKVIMNLDLSKASGPDCIPVVVLKNCGPKLSYILAELKGALFSRLLAGFVGGPCITLIKKLTDITQLLWLEMALFNKTALHNIEKHS